MSTDLAGEACLAPKSTFDLIAVEGDPLTDITELERVDFGQVTSHLKGVRMKGLVVVLLLAVSYGQERAPSHASGTPVADATRRWLQQEAAHLIAAAERMPPDKYGFQPTSQQMTFAKLMMHIVESNRYMCSGVAGKPVPKESGITEHDGKDKIIADVRASFDYCTRLLSSIDDSHLADEVPLFKQSRADVMMFLIADHADHYAVAAMHLRLNGLLPPTAKPNNQLKKP